ncbi:hypothetical protein F4814DRAFT_452611 [Daldinia grandis]|nr:hypothetical protein F4814DRAFT_452611 [Daldinia grandis]
MDSNQRLLFKEKGQEYGVVRSRLRHGRFSVQVISIEGNSSPCIITAVARNHLHVAIGDLVLLSADGSTSEDIEIVKVYREREMEELVVRREIPGCSKILPED